MNTQSELQSQWIGPNQCIDGKSHTELREATMKEDGIDYPIIVCDKCGYWG